MFKYEKKNSLFVNLAKHGKIVAVGPLKNLATSTYISINAQLKDWVDSMHLWSTGISVIVMLRVLGVRVASVPCVEKRTHFFSNLDQHADDSGC